MNVKRFNLVHIHISGPVACGKSVIHDCIANALEQLCVHVVTDMGGREERRADMNHIPLWERKMVQNTICALVEVNEPERQTTMPELDLYRDGYRAGIEAAAKVCEDMLDSADDVARYAALFDAAYSIRALADKRSG